MCLHSEVHLFSTMDRSCPDCVQDAERLILKVKYNFEKFRLESFAGWPLPYIDPRDLAANGFYSLRNGDLVKCNFCDVVIHEWEAGDDAMFEHQRYQPHCPMVLGRATKNIPLEPYQTAAPPPTPTPSASNGSTVGDPEPERGYDVPPDMSRQRAPQQRISWIPSIFRN